MTWETVTYEREKLYGEVWAEPIQKVAERYGVSDVALARTCRKLGVPTPPRGYWALKSVGKEPATPRLPPPARGQPNVLKRERWVTPRGKVARREPPAAPEAKIVVADALKEPHALIASSLPRLQRVAASRTWERFSRETRLDIRVTSEALDRALRIMDALIKALEERGHLVEIAPPGSERPNQWGQPAAAACPRATRAQVDGQWIEFGINEISDTARDSPEPQTARQRPSGSSQPRVERVPTGRLCLRISMAPWGWDVQHAWRDGKVQRLETCLNAVVRAMLDVAHARRVEAEKQERERVAREEAERKRQEETARRHLEAQMRYELSSRVDDHAYADRIRSFLGAIDRYAAEHGAIDPRSKVAAWMKWARDLADQIETSAIRTLLDFRPMPKQQA